MIIKADTKLSLDMITSEGAVFTITEQGGMTTLMIRWANGEEALDYEIRITNRDAEGLVELFGAVN